MEGVDGEVQSIEGEEQRGVEGVDEEVQIIKGE